MAEAEQAIPEHITQQALNLLNRELHGYGTDENIDAASEHDFDVLAHALLSAEARGRAAQREADARIADEYAAQKVEDAPFQDTEDLKERMLVYAKHARRIAAAIRNS